MGTVQHTGRGAGRISGDLGDLLPSPRPRPNTAPPRPKRDPVRTTVRTFGEVLITLGLVVLLFVVYEVYWTDVVSAGKQRDVTAQLEDRWGGETDPQRVEHFDGLGEGDGFAKMYIPAFGADFGFTIVEGTTAASLEVGPGHYTDTAYPGELGNFAVAGHRTGKGSPFNDINLINSCDAIIVETEYNWYVYRMMPKGEEKADWANAKGKDPRCEGVLIGGQYEDVVGQEIVSPSQGEVVAPIPNKPNATPAAGDQAALMTLTTCHPRFSDKQRLIVHAVLTNEYPKTAGERPKEFEEIG